MYQTIEENKFIESFDDYNRSDNFTIEAREKLFEYFEDLESGTGEKIELDVIAICCDYTEYENIKEVKKDYNDIENLEDLQDNTQVIELKNGGLIIQSF